MTRDDTLTASDDVIFREVGGEIVLLHLGSGTYFGLNEVGGRVWQLLEERPQSIAALCATIADEFSAAPEVVEEDVLALAAALAEHGLVTHPQG